MPESAPSTEPPASEQAAASTPASAARKGRRMALGLFGFVLWFWTTCEIVTALNLQVFPRLFPSGLLRPSAQPQGLLIQITLLLLIGVAATSLLSPTRRLLSLRVLPSLLGMFGLSFWLGGGEVAQLDERGLWRTQALGVADEFHPWSSIRRVKLIPYAWRRQTVDGLQAELRLRLAILPADAPASLVDLGPKVDWRRLDALLHAHAPIVTADEPDGLAASIYRFQPDAPAADLLGRYVVPAPAPTFKPPARPTDPIDYWWWKKTRQHRR